MYRVTRRLVDAIKQSGLTQTALAVAAGIDPTHLSKYLAGVAFGAVPADRLRRLGASLGVAVPVVLADFPEVDEEINERFAKDGYVIVWDWPRWRALVGHEPSGELLTLPEFVRRTGEDGRRWTILPNEAKRAYGSVSAFEARAVREEETAS